ncbi:C40 family peptidase [Candidatus Mcinerneyibacteriota bacterium]|nr:C40 family peptidase [Candidatus Mcinerneyibacteriota bacterium]
MRDYREMIEKAVRWAAEKKGSCDYPGRCLAFVEDAVEKGNGIEIFGGSTAMESALLYGWVTEGLPPQGAFVFYKASGPLNGVEKNWGHVGLSLGDGKVIHSWGEVRIDDYREIEVLTTPGWTKPEYLGWTPPGRYLAGAVSKN